MTSRTARTIGAATLVALFAGTEALILGMTGVTPAATTGALLGGFLGLVSLAIEMGLIERSARTFHAQGVQTTFMSFMMRLAIVASLTLLFGNAAIGVEPQAFALSYCGTFFVYMCWLTWVTYHAPVRIRPGVKYLKPAARDRRDHRDRARSAW